MPTIKDIAKVAGVSHGTVSNVLNGRGNVSVEKIKIVEEAAKKMGYQINAKAKSLRKGNARTISIILPNISYEQYYKMYDEINNNFTKLGYSTHLYMTYDQKKNEQAIIQKIASNRDYAVIVVSCLEDANEYYDQLNMEKENIIFVYRSPKNRINFAGFDFKQAGYDIAGKVNKRHNRIGIFTDSAHYSHANDFKEAFISSFLQRNEGAKFLSVHSTHATENNNAFKFFGKDKLDAIITTDFEKARYIKKAHFLGDLSTLPEIYSITDAELLIDESIYCYHLNYPKLGKEIFNVIVNNKIKTANALILKNKGFLFDEKQEVRQLAKKTINILTIPSPSTDALKKILPHFQKTTGIEARVAVYSFEEIYDILSDIENHKHYDIIRIDMAGLSWFAKKTLKPLSDLNIEISDLLSSYPKQVLDRYSLVNDIAYAIPFDPSVQMLFYRKDIFENSKYRRMFYEQYKFDLNIPTSFEEFKRIAHFLSQLNLSENEHIYGTSITTGNTEIIASEFLLRYYAEGGQLVQQSNSLNLTRQLAINALENYMDTLKDAKNITAKWWDESVSFFATGNLAMIIVYMNLFSDIAHTSISPLIGTAKVPGAKPLLGGGSLGISKYSNKNDEITIFFKWMFSNEIAEQITLLGGTTINQSIFSNQNITEHYPWLKFAYDTNYDGVRESTFYSGKNFNLRKVEKIIGLGVKNRINKIMSNEEVIDYINSRLAMDEFRTH